MGTITVRTRKDDSKAYTAQIVIKQNGVTVHREAQTFDRKQAVIADFLNRRSPTKKTGSSDQSIRAAIAKTSERAPIFRPIRGRIR